MLHLLKHGKSNGQTAKKLRTKLGLSLPRFMEQVHELRMQGVFICADNKGYYLASNEAEKQRQINSLNHRYKSIKKVADKLKTL